MRRPPLYSTPRRGAPAAAPRDMHAGAAPAAPDAPSAPPAAPVGASHRRGLRRALLGVGLLAVLAGAWQVMPPMPRPLTQKELDRAVLHTLANHPLPAPAAQAFEAVRGSVVKVIGYGDPDSARHKAAKDAPRPAKPEGKDKPPSREGGAEGDDPDERGIGTGVVIVDNGTILTNLHVVYGAKRIKVVFADGLEADADIVGLQPQNDLAVLKARKIPDDLQAATMRSTADLRPGDRVTAVGFPFGLGPSVSHGVVSGLKREFRSPEGQKILTNLIQFDAAANPGNSGGPLVTDDGAVVGIVTAIYNPTQERFFVGIGFAVPIENAAQAAGMPPF
ncbi:MAG TPA: trypsin-like peptidase domain-containing protein [Burkholderiaceae bacterium]|nr:trypsin-like peptidase domain-containing protein [Burkholderiaceae bacterium]